MNDTGPRPFYTWSIHRWNSRIKEYEPFTTVRADTASHALDAVEEIYGPGMQLNCKIVRRTDDSTDRTQFLAVIRDGNIESQLRGMAINLRHKLQEATEIEQQMLMDEIYKLIWPYASTVARCNEIMAILYGTPMWIAFRLHRAYLEAQGIVQIPY